MADIPRLLLSVAIAWSWSESTRTARLLEYNVVPTARVSVLVNSGVVQAGVTWQSAWHRRPRGRMLVGEAGRSGPVLLGRLATGEFAAATSRVVGGDVIESGAWFTVPHWFLFALITPGHGTVPSAAGAANK